MRLSHPAAAIREAFLLLKQILMCLALEKAARKRDRISLLS